MTPPLPPPPPARAAAPQPHELLSAASTVLSNNEPVLDGRRSVSAAALARQAVEAAVGKWLQNQGVGGGGNRRQDFLCLVALHPDPDLARRLHNVWARLSGACHATSYELPPTTNEIERWIDVVRAFITFDSPPPT